MNKDQENKNKDKNILNYASDYGKDLHEKTLMEETRKKEIKKYEKDHERDTKERINIYVDNLNIDKFDNSSNSHNTKSNADNDYSWRAEAGHDLNLNWEIPVSDPIEENRIIPRLPKSNNNIKEEDIKNSKIYKDMENNYKEALNKLKEKDEAINKYQEKIIKLEYMYKEKEEAVSDLTKIKKSLIKLINHFKGKVISEAVVDTVKILIDDKKEDGGIDE